MPITRKRLGEILIESGLVTKEQLSEALSLQEKSKGQKPLGELLIELGYLSEEGLSLSLSKKLTLRYLSFTDGSLDIKFDQNLDKLIDEKFARNNFVLPLSKTPQYLSIAMWDPLNFVVIDNIKKMTGSDLVIHCATKTDILNGIDRLYLHKGAFDTESTGLTSRWIAEDKTESLDELKSKAAEAPVIRMVNRLVQQAVRERASDIHIEPRESGVLIRFRINGILYEKESPPKDMAAPMVSRVKILSRLDIAEKRLPQDGGFMTKVDNRNVDFRVSTIPTIYGEKMAIRVLDKEQLNFDLSGIGLSESDLEKVSRNIVKPHGLIFLTGPTGSGKTTTLYCILSKIKSPQKNVITIEDPVEYRIDGVNQVQAMPQIGLDFARGLRTFLRQDPDIIMVG
ncbi:MAG: Flp pilus assembly complex ATPase component TadA, partial [Candidatus Omnitrophica bacterium]|nr:Flp pilus assembly complex ATPase component TadA [Candidatus Omnitrophota bacterium]